MSSCDDCGKVFKYPYILLRHLNRKVPCFSDINVTKSKNLYEKCNNFDEKCNKNYDKCNNILQCGICKTVFKNRQAKYYHKKNVNCVKSNSKLEEENEKLRKENEMLKLKSKTYNKTINNNNSKTLNKNNITYNIIYNPETRCLTTDDPDAPSPELLCFNGFKLEAARTKLKDIDQDILQRMITNVREQRDFISFYTFFFRNIDNKRMHMFTLGKNNNTTHAQVFNNGNIEKIDKLQLFDNVCKYIGQYLLNMSIENSDVIHMLTSEQASKNSFVEEQ